MGGICGIVFKKQGNRIQGDETLAAMVKALGFTDSEQGYMATGGHVGFGVQRNLQDYCSGIAKTIVQGRPVVLIIQGTLYGQSSDLLRRDNETREGIAQELLARYLKNGIRAVHDLRGDFSSGVWDGRQEELYLVTDRFRVNPVFYYEDGEKLVFASRMKSLLACPFPITRTINPQALTDIMAFSAITTDRTVFREASSWTYSILSGWQDVDPSVLGHQLSRTGSGQRECSHATIEN